MKHVIRFLKSLLVVCLSLFSLITFKTVILHYTRTDGVAILGYHGVVSDEQKKTIYTNDPYKMSVSEFDEQMSYLAKNGYHSLSMDELYRYVEDKNVQLPKKSVVITFDDGYENVLTNAYPILKKYNLQATTFLIGKKVTSNLDGYLKLSDIQNDETMQFYSHSFDLHHKASGFDRKKIDVISLADIADDFQSNQGVIDQSYFAFPYGRTKSGIEEILQSYDVKLAFGYNQNRKMIREDNRYLLPRYFMFARMPFAYFTWLVS